MRRTRPRIAGAPDTWRVVPDEVQPVTRPPLPERAGRTVQNERGEGEDDAAAPPAAPPRLDEIVDAEGGKEDRRPELQVEGEPRGQERTASPSGTGSIVEHHQGRHRRPTSQRGSRRRAHVPIRISERRRGDHCAAGERREERVTPAEEDRVTDQAQRGRHEGRREREANRKLRRA